MELNDKKKVASQLAFIHECLTQKQQYFVQEFEIAKDAIQTITSMFNKLNDEIKADEPKEQPLEAQDAVIPAE